MRILFVGDIVGKPGRRAIERLLPRITSEESIDFTIANGENAAGGMGLTAEIAVELLDHGVDVLTSGNHIWAKKEITSFLKEERKLLRPANYPEGAPGRGSGVFRSRLREKVGVLNLEGRVFMRNLDCPFRVAEKAIEELKKETRIIVVDFHAEATSEKIALGLFLDGKVSAVLGTHTHVQTADERVSNVGTAYMTDVGMTGPLASVIGIRKQIALNRFLTQIPSQFDVATEEVELQGAVIELDSESGRSRGIKRIRMPLKDRG